MVLQAFPRLAVAQKCGWRFAPGFSVVYGSEMSHNTVFSVCHTPTNTKSVTHAARTVGHFIQFKLLPIYAVSPS